MEDRTSYLNEDLIKELKISQEYIESEKIKQDQEIKRRNSLYRRNYNKEYDIENRIVVIVDDGAATGATLIATASWIRNREQQKKLIIGIPVAAKGTVDILSKECDMIVTGTIASSIATFKSVAQSYQELKPVEDEKVKNQ
jgi:putative phosphoribosyl transferase